MHCAYARSRVYDNRGSWVDNGCAATFRDGRDSGHRGNDAGKIVAGVAAVAILGAILSSNKDRDDRNADRGNNWSGSRVPDWAPGRYTGTDRETAARVDVTVGRDGHIDGYYGRDDIDGQFDGDRAYLGNRGYGAVSTRAGFTLTDDDGRPAIDFHRN